MAVEYTLYCDDCGGIIHASRQSARAARAEAQLQCGAYCGRRVDRCDPCRRKAAQLPEGAGGALAHSAGQQLR